MKLFAICYWLAELILKKKKKTAQFPSTLRRLYHDRAIGVLVNDCWKKSRLQIDFNSLKLSNIDSTSIAASTMNFEFVFFGENNNESIRDILANALFSLSQNWWPFNELKKKKKTMLNTNIYSNTKQMNAILNHFSDQINIKCPPHFYHSHLKIHCRKVCLSLISLANTVCCFV